MTLKLSCPSTTRHQNLPMRIVEISSLCWAVTECEIEHEFHSRCNCTRNRILQTNNIIWFITHILKFRMRKISQYCYSKRICVTSSLLEKFYILLGLYTRPSTRILRKKSYPCGVKIGKYNLVWIFTILYWNRNMKRLPSIDFEEVDLLHACSSHAISTDPDLGQHEDIVNTMPADSPHSHLP